MAGRRPKPAALHIVQGTHQPCRHGSKKVAKTSRYERGIPDIPDGLSEHATSAWDRVAPLLDRAGVLTTADSVALELMCSAYADWHEADAEIRAHGRVYETTSTSGDAIKKANPAVAMKADADRRIRAWLIEFGLTPASRSKLGGGKDDKPLDDPWAEFA